MSEINGLTLAYEIEYKDNQSVVVATTKSDPKMLKTNVDSRDYTTGMTDNLTQLF